MSRETIVPFAHRPPHQQPAFVKLHTLPDGDTVFILQAHLLTHIETKIRREDAVLLVAAMVGHFEIMPQEVSETVGKIGVTSGAKRGNETPCQHDFVRQVCPDIHQEDYFQCRKCGYIKP